MPRVKPRYLVNSDGTEVDAGDPLPVSFPTDGPNFDAFDRLRVSNPETIFDSKQIHDKQPLFWDEATVGAGSVGTWDANKASTMMTITGGAAAQEVTRQTFRRFNYQPGKSQLILITFTLDHTGGGTDIERYVGLFDDNNGIFLKDGEGTISLVRRTNVTGTPNDADDIAQASWNIDVFDGTGASGVTLDWTKSQIMVIDFEWLGVGRVRVGFVIDGIIYYAHQFNHANTLAGVYMSTPNLPIRFHIENLNVAGTGAASKLEHICSTVMSEGGSQDIGVSRSISTSTTFVSAAAAGTTYAVIGLRLDADHLDGVVKITGMSMLESAASSVEYIWKIIYDPTVANTANFSTSWTDVASSESFVEYAIADNADPNTNTVTNGVVIASGYVGAGGKSNASSSEVDTAVQLGSTISGTSKEIWLCVTPLSTNADIYGSLSWKEIS